MGPILLLLKVMGVFFSLQLGQDGASGLVFLLLEALVLILLPLNVNRKIPLDFSENWIKPKVSKVVTIMIKKNTIVPNNCNDNNKSK